ncbi:hypothetical protein IMZ11_28060 [Microtetraspora sp. AC03309]|uniref:GNAT family N-acetyltransferase n=1 Tax=Microtetraspora sp. AC03309 TaxID=2779376 RepID=UPI001E2A27EC|nr:GNAT family N-acetyltransferase [Microtetraspora sp. AC03309]MCC5579492.1 hypothetical protein [Microtetraspora sp. AC03309]
MELSLNPSTVEAAFRLAEVRELAATCVELSGIRGLRLFLSDDLARWASHMRSAAGTDGVNPTFDPGCGKVAPGESLCLWVRDETGGTVACIAGRVFETTDFTMLVRSLKLWFDPVPAGMPDGLRLVLPATFPTLAGRVGHVGGLWIHPEFRGKGLSTILARLARGAVLDRFAADWDTWVSFRKIADKAVLTSAYGTADAALCVDGFFPPTNRHEQVFLSFATRAQVLHAVRDGVAALAGAMRPYGPREELAAVSR